MNPSRQFEEVDPFELVWQVDQVTDLLQVGGVPGPPALLGSEPAARVPQVKWNLRQRTLIQTNQYTFLVSSFFK